MVSRKTRTDIHFDRLRFQKFFALYSMLLQEKYGLDLNYIL